MYVCIFYGRQQRYEIQQSIHNRPRLGFSSREDSAAVDSGNCSADQRSMMTPLFAPPGQLVVARWPAEVLKLERSGAKDVSAGDAGTIGLGHPVVGRRLGSEVLPGPLIELVLL